jgi:hypothetical protein
MEDECKKLLQDFFKTLRSWLKIFNVIE